MTIDSAKGTGTRLTIRVPITVEEPTE